MTKTILSVLIASFAAASVYAAEPTATASSPAATPTKTEHAAKPGKHHALAPKKAPKHVEKAAPKTIKAPTGTTAPQASAPAAKK